MPSSYAASHRQSSNMLNERPTHIFLANQRWYPGSMYWAPMSSWLTEPSTRRGPLGPCWSEPLSLTTHSDYKYHEKMRGREMERLGKDGKFKLWSNTCSSALWIAKSCCTRQPINYGFIVYEALFANIGMHKTWPQAFYVRSVKPFPFTNPRVWISMIDSWRSNKSHKSFISFSITWYMDLHNSIFLVLIPLMELHRNVSIDPFIICTP